MCKKVVINKQAEYKVTQLQYKCVE